MSENSRKFYGGRFIQTTSKQYPHMLKVTQYRNPYFLPDKSGMPSFRRDPEDLEKFIADQRSISRTKIAISDIVICNKFEWFCTFTFDKRKHDRYNVDKCKIVMETWLRNSRRNHSPNLQYLMVPEFHKDGALHFHGFISNYNSIIKSTKVQQNGRIVHNISGFRAGFSSAVKIDNHEAVGSYVKKYITKDMPMIFGRKRYFCSQNLIRPIKFTDKHFLHQLPMFRNKVYENFDVAIYEIPNF